MTTRKLKRLVLKAVGKVFEADSGLLERNAGERAICGKLATYLAPLFPDHSVDVEYDRHGLDRKTLHLPQICRGGGLRKVVPDIVIHRRGVDDDNLLAVELKKETNPEPRACDRAKLRAMRRQLGYKVGALIVMPAGPGSKARKAHITWYS